MVLSSAILLMLAVGTTSGSYLDTKSLSWRSWISVSPVHSCVERINAWLCIDVVRVFSHDPCHNICRKISRSCHTLELATTALWLMQIKICAH